MGIRDILVHLDNLDATENRLELAVNYAIKHEANLRGLYLTKTFFEHRNSLERSNYERVESMFREKVSAAGIKSNWVRPATRSGIPLDVTDIMTTQAYYTDLVIVGQSNSKHPNLNIPPELPERLVMLCGRPVLVVPYTGCFKTAGDRIMIAWRAGRESVRSVNDAMPCIEKSHHVSVVEVCAEAIPSESNDHIIYVRDFIAQHKVAARTEQIYAGSFSIGDTILNLACEKTADLLVMGAYTHSKRGTMTLSPIANHILKHLTVPVLMSH
ncbi:MAG: universal stress protein [Desulfuromonadaceae bacterium]|nr:universal stress protein [Desulfuromonadaceae bacterium]